MQTGLNGIGGVEAVSPIWLAPLAGVTTRTLRAFHAARGAGLVHTEMISAVGLAYKNRKTAEMIGHDDEVVPVVLQLFSPDADSLVRGAEVALSYRSFPALEVNMACPMPKVTKKGAGARLLERPDEAMRMVAGLKRFGLPVWVKTRITDPVRHPLPTEAFCDALFGVGAENILLHGRTPAQRYEGRADKDAVTAMAVRYPGRIVASGDFYVPEDAAFYLAGGAAAVLAARGMLRDVSLIPRTLLFLGYPVPDAWMMHSLTEQIDGLLEMGEMGLRAEGESFTLVQLKRMLPGLFKGFPGAAAIRQACAACRDWRSLEAALREQRCAAEVM